jgi:hypothetical protein
MQILITVSSSSFWVTIPLNKWADKKKILFPRLKKWPRFEEIHRISFTPYYFQSHAQVPKAQITGGRFTADTISNLVYPFLKPFLKGAKVRRRLNVFLPHTGVTHWVFCHEQNSPFFA